MSMHLEAQDQEGSLASEASTVSASVGVESVHNNVLISEFNHPK